MRVTILLFCCVFASGQSVSPAPDTKSQGPASSSDQKNQRHFGLGIGTQETQVGRIEVLSDTKGVDFRPYIKRVSEQVRENWYHLIPECAAMMKGELAIEFAITKDGRVPEMRLVAASAITILDRAAWGSITASNPFPPLPSEFTGPHLALRLRFSYNPDKSDSDNSGKGCRDDPIKNGLAHAQTNTKSGIAVSIAKPIPGDLEVPLGGSKLVAAVVTGTGIKENSVDWSLSGLGCSRLACGEITGDAYRAPTVMSNPQFVTLTAVSKADPTAKASLTLHIVHPASPR